MRILRIYCGMRPDDMELYHGTNEAGEKVGFINTAIHRDAHKPLSRSIDLHEESDPISATEKTGPKWGKK